MFLSRISGLFGAFDRQSRRRMPDGPFMGGAVGGMRSPERRAYRAPSNGGDAKAIHGAKAAGR
ncbi:MAG: hypothetical protein ACJAVS_001991 [Paracoccaceae bacterium]|jgi:hypothetical protein